MNELVDQVGRALAHGDVAGAEALVAKAADRPADHALGLAVLALARRDLATAATQVERAKGLGAMGPALQLGAAIKLVSGDAAGAVDEARKAVAADPSTRNRAALGSILLAARRPSDALAILKQVAVEDPEGPDLQLSLGMAASQAHEYPDAIAAFSRAFEQAPTDGRPIEQLLVMFADVGRWLGAAAALELSRGVEQPPHIAVTLDLVMLQIMRAIAERYPQRGLAADPDAVVDRLIADALRRSPGVQLAAARSLLEINRLDEVKQLVDRLGKIQLASDEVAILEYLRGYLAAEAKDHPRAIAHYARAVELDPRRGDACTNAISLLLQDGTPAAGAQIAGLLGRVEPGQRAQPDLMFNEAIFLARANRTADARKLLELLARDGKHAASARQVLAELAR